MSVRVGIIVFARFDSRRLPGKALQLVGGMPLLERVLRRAQLLEWPVYLATTENASDDALVSLADSLGVESFRGPEERVLERAVLAAEAFRLDAFARLCGDRPLFPVRTLEAAIRVMADSERSRLPDLVSNRLGEGLVPGLTTEVVRTVTLRSLLDRGVSAEEQEHLTQYFYTHRDEWRIVQLLEPQLEYRCPGFSVDTESDLRMLNRIFSLSDAIDLSPAQADGFYRDEQRSVDSGSAGQGP